MFRQKNMQQASFNAPDDRPVFAIYKDLSGGQNTRVWGGEIAQNQATALTNIDLGEPGKISKIPGSILIGNDVGTDSPSALHNFRINGATDQLVMYEDQRMWKWVGSGNWSALSLVSLFSASTDVGIISAKMSGIAPDDVIMVQNDIDNARIIQSNGTIADLGSTAGTGSDSPPKSTVMCWYGNRIWILDNTNLYFSSAYPADYSTAFDTVADVFRVPVGEERGLVPTMDLGIVVLGDKAVWSLFPQATPSVSDRPEALISDLGCVSKKGWCTVGDDVYFFAQDGLREVKRTVQERVQGGASYPISYVLKDEFDSINWNYADRISMEFFDNKIFITVPTGATTFSTWIYFPVTNAFSVMSGINPNCWAKYKVDGEENLYYGKYGDGKVYQAWTGQTFEGTTETNGTKITMTCETRKEDFGQPLVDKVGGSVEVRALATGNHDLDIYARFDDGGWNTLGTMNLTGNLITFPVSFPVNFTEAIITKKKFPIDSYGEWRHVQIKTEHDDTNDDDDITVIEQSVTSYTREYEGE